MSRKPLSSRNSEHPPRPGGAGGAVKGKKKGRGHFCLDRVTLVTDFNRILDEIPAYGQMVLTEDDLKTPTPERIQLLYLKLLDFCFGVSLESLKQPPFQENVMEHPELMEEFTYRIQFFRTMKRFMKTCLVSDFMLEDIFNPDSRRTCRFLSAVDEYIKFHVNVYQHDSEIDSVSQSRDEIRDEVEELSRANSELKKELSSLEQQRHQEHDLEEELKEKIKSQGQVMQEKKCSEEYLTNQYKSASEAKQFSEQRLVGLTRDLEKCSLRVDDLMKKVVTSPDKLRANLARLQRECSEVVASSKETEAMLRMWESLASQAHQTPRGVMVSLEENLYTLTSKVEENNCFAVQCETMEEQILRLNQQLREITHKHQQLQQFLKTLDEEKDRLASQSITVSHPRATEDAKRDIVQLKQEAEQRRQNDEHFVEMTYAKQRELAECKEATSSALAEIEEVTRELLRAQQKRATEFQDLMSRLGVDIFETSCI